MPPFIHDPCQCDFNTLCRTPCRLTDRGAGYPAPLWPVPVAVRYRAPLTWITNTVKSEPYRICVVGGGVGTPPSPVR